MFDTLVDAVAAYRAADAERRAALKAETAAHRATRAVIEELRVAGHVDLIRALAMESANDRAPTVRARYTAEIDRLIEAVDLPGAGSAR